MAQQTLNIGTTANDGTGDTLRVAMDKVNDNFDEIYASPIINDHITITGNEIRANRSNDDLVLEPSGTGVVTAPAVTIDANINITDNVIKTTVSNADLVLSPSGTGSVVISKGDINSGTIDNTVIGGSTAAAGTFTTVTANTSASIDGIVISDNTITSTSNADLELSGAGTGTVSVNGLKFPTTDGSTGQFLKTDGSGNLGFATAGATLNHSDINDGTTTIASSASTEVDSFSTATYRSAKYTISISDATNSRFEIVEANVVHGPSADSTTEAYLTVFGRTSSYGDPGELCTFTADINNGNVRLLATNITSDSTVFKFQRTLIDL
ncbi:MAG: hypothetical protein VW715_14115 [Rhodospirillales bacterium]